MARVIAVIGAGECDDETRAQAHEVGRLLAEAGCVVINGGLGGVMEAASAGARAVGGTVVGVVPSEDPRSANAHVSIAIASGMGDGRNAILANTAEAFVAVGGAYGTLSEIALALKRGKRVVSVGSWTVDPAIEQAADPEDAVRRLLRGEPDSGAGPRRTS